MSKRLLEEQDSTFAICQLPVEIVIQIGYKYPSPILQLFCINKQLYAIQKARGFWSSLFKTSFPNDALTIYAFLRECPDLTNLSKAAITDILMLSAAFHSFDNAHLFRNRHNTLTFSPLVDIEKSILKGNIDVLDALYTREVRENGQIDSIKNGTYSFDITQRNNRRFIVRKYLIKLYLVLEKAQIPDYLQQTLSFAEALCGNAVSYNMCPVDAYNLVFDWVKEFRNEKSARFKRYTASLLAILAEYDTDLEISVIYEGIGSVKVMIEYLADLEKQFIEYFGLTEEEGDSHWKKLYIQKRRFTLPEPFSV